MAWKELSYNLKIRAGKKGAASRGCIIVAHGGIKKNKKFNVKGAEFLLTCPGCGIFSIIKCYRR